MRNCIIVGLLSLLLFACGRKGTDVSADKDGSGQEMRKGNILNSLMIIVPVKSVTAKTNKVYITGNDTVYELSFGYKHDFNEDGNFTSTELFDVEGIALSKTKYMYDEDGNLTGTKTFGIDNNLSNFSVVTKSETKDMRIQTFYNQYDDIISVSSVYKDSYGNIIKEKSDDSEKTFVYDKKNKLVEYSVIIKKTEMHFRFVYEYDNETFPVRTIQYDDNGNIVSEQKHDYSIDKRGNWIIKNTYDDNVLVTVETREFNY